MQAGAVQPVLGPETDPRQAPTPGQLQPGQKGAAVLIPDDAPPAAGAAVIQSSSATTVMVVGFVNSGIMTLNQAVGVIMGSNVGTTVTAWILSLSGLEGDSFIVQVLKPSTLAPLLGTVGMILYMFTSSR